MAPIPGLAQDAAIFFQKNCAACHTIGGGQLLGPDLRNVLERQNRKWLVGFIVNPQGTLDKGDPYGKKLLADANGMVMPTVSGVDTARAETILDWIASQSNSAGPAAPTTAEPLFTPDDAAHGRELVLGSHSLANGGPPCISCHTSRGLPSLGGGALGPDLTHEYTRLGGRQAVTGWLSSPPTPTMQAAYKTHPLKPEEIRLLAAWLESESKAPVGPPATGRRVFLALGMGGCLIALALMDVFWRKRFNAVRRPLVTSKRSSR
ncbi:MAG: c-type cytochrome [Terriglobia bacterium]